VSLLTVFQAISNTPPGLIVRKSTFIFPAVEVAHLLSLTLLLGAVLALDLRLLGVGLTRQKPSQIAGALSPILWLGAGLAIVTGTILFVGEPVKCFYNAAFWWKMSLLAVAVIFQFSLFARVANDDRESVFLHKAVAVTSLALWFSVGFAGRAIGFI
jgi:hypothetical protein